MLRILLEKFKLLIRAILNFLWKPPIVIPELMGRLINQSPVQPLYLRVPLRVDSQASQILYPPQAA